MPKPTTPCRVQQECEPQRDSEDWIGCGSSEPSRQQGLALSLALASRSAAPEVQTLAGVLLPSATAFLLLCNDRAVLGPWVNS